MAKKKKRTAETQTTEWLERIEAYHAGESNVLLEEFEAMYGLVEKMGDDAAAKNDYRFGVLTQFVNHLVTYAAATEIFRRKHRPGLNGKA